MTKRHHSEIISTHKSTRVIHDQEPKSTPMTGSDTNGVDIHNPAARRAALSALKSTALMIPEAEVAPRNLAPLDTSVLVLRALPAMRVLKAEMIAVLVHPPVEQLEALESTALATYQAELEAGVTGYTPSELEKNYQMTILPRRRRLFKIAELMVEHGLLESNKVAAVRRGTSHQDEVASMMGIAGVLRDAWPNLDGKVPMTLADLDTADVEGQEFLYKLTAKDSPVATSEQVRVRDAMLTLLLRRYDDVRKAVSFLRWSHQDADDIAPSPFVSRVKTRRRSQESDDTPTLQNTGSTSTNANTVINPTV